WLRDDGSLWPSFALAGLACAALQVQRFGAAVFGALERFRFDNIARILQGASLALAVTLLAIQGSISLTTVMAALAGSHLLAAGFLLACLGRHWRQCGSHSETGAPVVTDSNICPTAKGWLVESVPLGLGD